MLESANLPTHHRAWHRTDDFIPGAPKVKLVVEPLPWPLSPTQVLIKVRAVALNYRDANIANGGNSWPVLAHGILDNDAASEVVALGGKAVSFVVGDREAPLHRHRVRHRPRHGAVVTCRGRGRRARGLPRVRREAADEAPSASRLGQLQHHPVRWHDGLVCDQGPVDWPECSYSRPGRRCHARVLPYHSLHAWHLTLFPLYTMRLRRQSREAFP
ncbi:hypothetical protein LZ31DRAFT_554936 [Colletotrichum somersetense]|nr:hypothetical protein LZ31DRAFT_554936 [Colletotrichum somersetense]